MDLFAYCSSDNVVHILRWVTWQKVMSVALTKENGMVLRMIWSPDGASLALCTRFSQICILPLDQGRVYALTPPVIQAAPSLSLITSEQVKAAAADATPLDESAARSAAAPPLTNPNPTVAVLTNPNPFVAGGLVMNSNPSIAGGLVVNDDALNTMPEIFPLVWSFVTYNTPYATTASSSRETSSPPPPASSSSSSGTPASADSSEKMLSSNSSSSSNTSATKTSHSSSGVAAYPFHSTDLSYPLVPVPFDSVHSGAVTIGQSPFSRRLATACSACIPPSLLPPSESHISASSNSISPNVGVERPTLGDIRRGISANLAKRGGWGEGIAAGREGGVGYASDAEEEGRGGGAGGGIERVWEDGPLYPPPLSSTKSTIDAWRRRLENALLSLQEATASPFMAASGIRVPCRYSNIAQQIASPLFSFWDSENRQVALAAAVASSKGARGGLFDGGSSSSASNSGEGIALRLMRLKEDASSASSASSLLPEGLFFRGFCDEPSYLQLNSAPSPSPSQFGGAACLTLLSRAHHSSTGGYYKPYFQKLLGAAVPISAVFLSMRSRFGTGSPGPCEELAVGGATATVLGEATTASAIDGSYASFSRLEDASLHVASAIESSKGATSTTATSFPLPSFPLEHALSRLIPLLDHKSSDSSVVAMSIAPSCSSSLLMITNILRTPLKLAPLLLKVMRGMGSLPLSSTSTSTSSSSSSSSSYASSSLESDARIVSESIAATAAAAEKRKEKMNGKKGGGGEVSAVDEDRWNRKQIQASLSRLLKRPIQLDCDIGVLGACPFATLRLIGENAEPCASAIPHLQDITTSLTLVDACYKHAAKAINCLRSEWVTALRPFSDLLRSLERGLAMISPPIQVEHAKAYYPYQPFPLASSEFYRLLTLGVLSPTISSWLEDTAREETLSRLHKSLESAFASMEVLSVNALARSIELASVALGELQAEAAAATWTDSDPHISAVADATRGTVPPVNRFYSFVKGARQFSFWGLTPTALDAAQQELTHLAALLQAVRAALAHARHSYTAVIVWWRLLARQWEGARLEAAYAEGEAHHVDGTGLDAAAAQGKPPSAGPQGSRVRLQPKPSPMPLPQDMAFVMSAFRPLSCPITPFIYAPRTHAVKKGAEEEQRRHIVVASSALRQPIPGDMKPLTVAAAAAAATPTAGLTRAFASPALNTSTSSAIMATEADPLGLGFVSSLSPGEGPDTDSKTSSPPPFNPAGSSSGKGAHLHSTKTENTSASAPGAVATFGTTLPLGWETVICKSPNDPLLEYSIEDAMGIFTSNEFRIIGAPIACYADFLMEKANSGMDTSYNMRPAKQDSLSDQVAYAHDRIRSFFVRIKRKLQPPLSSYSAPPLQIDIPIYPGQTPEDASATLHAICGSMTSFFDDDSAEWAPPVPPPESIQTCLKRGSHAAGKAATISSPIASATLKNPSTPMSTGYNKSSLASPPQSASSGFGSPQASLQSRELNGELSDGALWDTYDPSLWLEGSHVLVIPLTPIIAAQVTGGRIESSALLIIRLAAEVIEPGASRMWWKRIGASFVSLPPGFSVLKTSYYGPVTSSREASIAQAEAAKTGFASKPASPGAGKNSIAILLHKSESKEGSVKHSASSEGADGGEPSEDSGSERQMQSGFYLAQLKYRDIPFNLVPAPLTDVRPQPCTHSLHTIPITSIDDVCAEKIRFIGRSSKNSSEPFDLRTLSKLVAATHLAACGTRGVVSASVESRLHVFDMEEDEEET